MNFNPKPAATPTPEPKKNHNSIIYAVIIASIAIAITTLGIYTAIQMNEKWQKTFNPDPTPEQILMHKCNNLQQYYGEVGVDVNIRCDRLVHALVD